MKTIEAIIIRGIHDIKRSALTIQKLEDNLMKLELQISKGEESFAKPPTSNPSKKKKTVEFREI